MWSDHVYYQYVIHKSPIEDNDWVRMHIKIKNNILHLFPPAKKYNKYTAYETFPYVRGSLTPVGSTVFSL